MAELSSAVSAPASSGKSSVNSICFDSESLEFASRWRRTTNNAANTNANTDTATATDTPGLGPFLLLCVVSIAVVAVGGVDLLLSVAGAGAGSASDSSTLAVTTISAKFCKPGTSKSVKRIACLIFSSNPTGSSP